MRIRVKYSIGGKLKFISHLDLMRLFFRACIRTNIPVAVSQGFSPHLKISFGPPLNLGVTRSGEYLDINTTQDMRLQDVEAKLQQTMPEGIDILRFMKFLMKKNL